MTSSPPMRGYTLLELIVSIGIFSVIMLFVTSAYLTLLTIDKEVRASTALVTNLSFALDSMTRSIRTGNNYGCNSTGGGTSGTNGTCSSFSYTDTTLNQKVTYIRKSDNTIGRCIGTGVCTDAAATSLTDPNITIPSNGLTFYVRGVGTTAPNDTVQAQVTISVRGTMMASNGRTADFSIQTSATQRYLDI